MPSNQNIGKNTDGDENGNNAVKAMVLNPSQPMREAFNKYCAQREAELFGTLSDNSAGEPESWLDVEFRKGIQSDVLREAVTHFLNSKGFEWVEPERERERTSDVFRSFQMSHPKLANESADEYKARYVSWKKERDAENAFHTRNEAALQTKRMEKMQSILALEGKSGKAVTPQTIADAYAEAIKVFPDGTEVLKRREKKETA